MANTRIDYLYRDSSNYKSYQYVILNGQLDREQIETILGCLFDGEYFIPEYLDFPADRNWDFNPEVDDAFWELDRADFTDTDKEPNIDLTPEQVVNQFRKLKDEWNRLSDIYPDVDFENSIE